MHERSPNDAASRDVDRRGSIAAEIRFPSNCLDHFVLEAATDELERWDQVGVCGRDHGKVILVFQREPYEVDSKLDIDALFASLRWWVAKRTSVNYSRRRSAESEGRDQAG